MSAREISTLGVLELAESEGIVLGPYLDSQRIWTVYVGHTKAAGGPDPAKLARVDTRAWSDDRMWEEIAKAVALFDDDLDGYEARVRRAIKVPLKQHQFDALVSFDFNTGGIDRANLTKAINRGDFSGDGFMAWLKPKEIIGRRKGERDLFRTGDYHANGDDIPVYDALPSGALRYRTKIKGAELLQRMPKRGATALIERFLAATPAADPVKAPSRPALAASRPPGPPVLPALPKFNWLWWLK